MLQIVQGRPGRQTMDQYSFLQKKPYVDIEVRERPQRMPALHGMPNLPPIPGPEKQVHF